MRDCLSTAEVEYAKAQQSLDTALDDEWDQPNDPAIIRRVQFWTREVEELGKLPADTVIPLH